MMEDPSGSGLAQLLGDLFGEVLFLLLQALALLEAIEGLHLDGATHFLGHLGHVLLHGDLVLLHEGLLHQAVLLIELAQLAHDDAFLHLVGLGGHLGVVGQGEQLDLLLLVQGLLADVGLVQIGGVHGGDLHGQVLAQLDDLLVLLQAGGDLHVQQHADAAVHVVVGDAHAAVEAGEAADLDVLADGEDHLLQGLLHGQAGLAIGEGHQGLHVHGAPLAHHVAHVLDELHELVVLGHEVGLGVDLHQGGAVGEDLGVSHALGGDAAGLLLGGGQALLPQELNSLVHVAVGLGQRLLAVQHAHAGHLAQGFYISSSKCHGNKPPKLIK